MCLTIPKKVLQIKENSVIVENAGGDRQELKTLIELAVGDFVISQQGVIIEKIDQKEAEEILQYMTKKGDTYG